MTPLLLLDDVMSELDPERRERLVELLGGPGQVVITAATEESVPAALRADAIRMPMPPRRAVVEAAEAAMTHRRAPRPGRGRRCARRWAGGAEDEPGGGPGGLGGERRRADRGGRAAGLRAGRDVVVACADPVWAEELDLMQEQLLGRLRERLGEQGPERLRFRADRARP